MRPKRIELFSRRPNSQTIIVLCYAFINKQLTTGADTRLYLLILKTYIECIGYINMQIRVVLDYSSGYVWAAGRHASVK